MVRGLIGTAVALLLATAGAAATLTAPAMYAAALAREQAVRTALSVPQPDIAVLQETRAIVNAYETLVRRYPVSGYSDDALWQGGRLALEAFARFGQPQDKATGIRLLRAVATQYPLSKHTKHVADELSAMDAAAPSRAVPTIAPVTDAPKPNPPARVATVTAVHRLVTTDTVRVTIELDREVPFHDERLADPARVFVDLTGARAAGPLLDKTLRFDGDPDLVRQIRIGRQPNSTTRIVLDAAGVSSYSVYPLYDPFRLVVDCVRERAKASAPAAAVGPPLPLPAAPAPVVASPPSMTAATPDTALGGIAAPPAKSLAGGYSIARQLGLSVSRIVIDPGHGGHDPGAKGKGITEAELVLDVARRLEKLLLQTPGVEVILTRRTDDFIQLQERTAIANREGADLFLSIHANASSSLQVHGVETYFLNFANNLSAASVAARENAASGQAMAALPDFVKAIALNNKLDESRDFATQVQRAMLDRLRGPNKNLKDLGVKQAPFVVLIGAAMPSVLAEISFITNPQEARLLKGNAYRQRIAEALFNAIRKYQTSLKNVTTVAHQ